MAEGGTAREAPTCSNLASAITSAVNRLETDGISLEQADDIDASGQAPLSGGSALEQPDTNGAPVQPSLRSSPLSSSAARESQTSEAPTPTPLDVVAPDTSDVPAPLPLPVIDVAPLAVDIGSTAPAEPPADIVPLPLAADATLPLPPAEDPKSPHTTEPQVPPHSAHDEVQIPPRSAHDDVQDRRLDFLYEHIARLNAKIAERDAEITYLLNAAVIMHGSQEATHRTIAELQDELAFLRDRALPIDRMPTPPDPVRAPPHFEAQVSLPCGMVVDGTLPADSLEPAFATLPSKGGAQALDLRPGSYGGMRRLALAGTDRQWRLDRARSLPVEMASTTVEILSPRPSRLIPLLEEEIQLPASPLRGAQDPLGAPGFEVAAKTGKDEAAAHMDKEDGQEQDVGQAEVEGRMARSHEEEPQAQEPRAWEPPSQAPQAQEPQPDPLPPEPQPQEPQIQPTSPEPLQIDDTFDANMGIAIEVEEPAASPLSELTLALALTANEAQWQNPDLPESLDLPPLDALEPTLVNSASRSLGVEEAPLQVTSPAVSPLLQASPTPSRKPATVAYARKTLPKVALALSSTGAGAENSPPPASPPLPPSPAPRSSPSPPSPSLPPVPSPPPVSPPSSSSVECLGSRPGKPSLRAPTPEESTSRIEFLGSPPGPARRIVPQRSRTTAAVKAAPSKRGKFVPPRPVRAASSRPAATQAKNALSQMLDSLPPISGSKGKRGRTDRRRAPIPDSQRKRRRTEREHSIPRRLESLLAMSDGRRGGRQGEWPKFPKDWNTWRMLKVRSSHGRADWAAGDLL